MRSFDSFAAAFAHMETEIDQPIRVLDERLRGGIRFKSYPIELGNGAFTNVYDISYDDDSTIADIRIHDRLVNLYELALHEEHTVVTNAGFFFLADIALSRPRQPSLNLAIRNTRVLSMPVTDMEAILCRDGRLVSCNIPAYGKLKLNGMPPALGRLPDNA
jgi:hypothetical protein